MIYILILFELTFNIKVFKTLKVIYLYIDSLITEFINIFKGKDNKVLKVFKALYIVLDFSGIIKINTKDMDRVYFK